MAFSIIARRPPVHLRLRRFSSLNRAETHGLDLVRPPLHGVVFDMDGTLTVPNLDFKEMYRRAGVPKGEDILSAKWRADSNASAIVEEMEEEGRRTLQLMPGAAELVTWLAAHGIRTALVTRNSTRTVTHFHNHVWPEAVPNMTPCISRDDSWPSKPDPTSLFHIANQWQVPAGPSLMMVGDSPSNDVAFGKAAGVRTALLDTGRRLTEGGKTGNPDIVVENLVYLARRAWQMFDIKSPLTDACLHTKKPAPVPTSGAAMAAAAGDLATLEKLEPEMLSIADPLGQTPLIWAADAGHLPVVKLLLQAGVEIDAQGFLGATAISRAARRGHKDVLSTLLDHGANPDIPNVKLQFPLHFAAFKLKSEAVRVLLQNGANPLVLDRKGRTPAEDTSDDAIRSEIQTAQQQKIGAILTD